MSTELGYIYVMSSANTAFKIGASTNHPSLRAKQLSASSGVQTPFFVAYSRHVRYPFAAEAEIHELLADYRVNDSREFFNAPLSHIIRIIEQYDEVPVVAHIKSMNLPFSELFASFGEDDGKPRTLTADEQAKCRELERSLSR